MDCSYGFRPRRSAHHALEELWKGVMASGGGWIIDLDIRKFFDTMSPVHLREILKRRVRDGVLLRLIGKWLKAGVWEHGSVSYPELGSPQGGVVSPILSNVYLHEVLDTWFSEQVMPRLRGKASLVRFADDAVMILSNERDAQRVMEVLPKRFGQYGLTVHPEKTQMIRFTRPTSDDGEGGRTFSFLGFTHYWGRSRKGYWTVKRKTEKGRLSRALKAMNDWCRRNRHQHLREQQKVLRSKLRGHYNYYGITGNFRALQRFFFEVRKAWQKWLNRRTRGNPMPWQKFLTMESHYPLLRPRIAHSYA